MRKRISTFLLSLCVAFTALLLASSASWGMTPAPGWMIMGNSTPTVLPPGSEGDVELWVIDDGGEESAPGAVVTDTLPADLMPTGESQIMFGVNKVGECTDTGQTVKCEFPAGLPTDGEDAVINIDVRATSEAKGSVVDHATISGGGALQSSSTSFSIAFGTKAPGAGIAHFYERLSNVDGTTDTQAGSHPYKFITVYAMNNVILPGEKPVENCGCFQEDPAVGEERNLNVNLPPGFVGNTQAVPQCPRIDMVRSVVGNCPADTVIGFDRATVQGIQLATNEPVYNMVPPSGVASQYAFDQSGNTDFLNAGVRTGGDNGIAVHVPDIPEKDITFNITEVWGVPAESSHDRERGGPTDVALSPLLTLPTSCQGPQEYTMEELSTWQNEQFVGAPISEPTVDNNETPVGFSGCERLQPFSPDISIAPDTSYADTPAGLSVDVSMPQGLNPEGLQTPGLKDTTVVLPEGVVINPGQATGLVACQPSQEAFGAEANGEVDEGPVSCPSASRVGTVEIESPLLRDKMQGGIYILGSNPPNLQLLIAASGDGVNLKLVGNVHLNENTGQLTTTFEKSPDFPFTNFRLSFSGGAQAALATPTRCGTYGSTISFSPWSSPFIEDEFLTSRFQITSGPGGSPCTWPMPFAPSMTAGATTDQAGGYTNFTLLLQRGDGQQRIEKLQFKTPEGLLGMLAKVPLCGEPQAASGECPEASQIGHTVATAGPGPYPFEVPQAGAPPAPIYLTGPYEGAPFGLSIKVPLIAGPFNLGTEIVRAKIEVDPITAQLTITTTKFPVTVKGIPTDIRTIDAVIDRPEFMFNPTSCESRAFSGTAYSLEGATAPLSSHFQMGSCRALTFQPNLQASTPAKVSRTEGTSFKVNIVYPTGNLGANQASSQSNIHSVKVELPKQLPSRLTTLQKACRAAIFEANPANCPQESAVGHATAITPVLPVPVTGPAYFVSNGSAKFPELIVVLKGYGVTVDLHGNTFISRNGITSATFEAIPDVPIGSFELEFPAGPYSALTGNGNLCKENLQMPTHFVGQNGAVLDQNTKISVTGCSATKKTNTKPKKKHKTKKHKKQRIAKERTKKK